MARKQFRSLSESPNWTWREGSVDRKREHIKITYGNPEQPDWNKFDLVALIAPPVKKILSVQYVISSGNPRYQEIIDKVKCELGFYLVEKGERKPWSYAIHHCSTAANAYSHAHWVYYPAGDAIEKKTEGTMNHSQCVKKLIEVGNELGFHAVGKSSGKKYELGNPDCVWYYAGKGQEVFGKIARGEKATYLPFITFEVAFSEKEKNLRGSLVTLQLTNAAANIIVLLGESVGLKVYLKKLIGRYSFGRFRIWTETNVEEMYMQVMKKR